MAYDKVVDSSALEANLTAIADAIRAKTGKTAKLTLEQMPAEIAGISSGDNQLDGLLSSDGSYLYDILNNRLIAKE